MKQVFVSLLLLFTFITFGYTKEPDPNELKKITKRGKQLAEYDAVIWQASDSLAKLKPNKDKIKQYVAKKINGQWQVAFGELKNDSFSIYAQAYQDKKNVDHFEVKIKDGLDGTEFLNEARAFETAYQAFIKTNKIDRQYNVLMIPAPKDQIYVYLVPAALKKDIYPLGGDSRFLIDTSGKKIIKEIKLHRGILEVSSKNKKFTRSFSIIHNMPVDTDVYHVIIRKPRIPHLILALNKEWVFRISRMGKIKFLGKDRKAFGIK